MRSILACAHVQEISEKAGYACGQLFILVLLAIPLVVCIRWWRAAKTPGARVAAILGVIVFGLLPTGAVLGIILRPKAPSQG